MRFPGLRGVFLVLCLASLAGCANPEQADRRSEPEDKTASFAGWVHRSEARPATASAFAGELPLFKQLYVGDRASGEPTIAFTPDGAAFYAGYSNLTFDIRQRGPLQQQMRLDRSRDQGITWEEVTPIIAGDQRMALGGDPLVTADSATGRVYYSIYGLHGSSSCIHIAWSSDQGDTWTRNPFVCAGAYNDHPTIFFGPAPDGSVVPGRAMYLCTNSGAAMCAHSSDGGATWDYRSPAYSNLNQVGACGESSEPGLTGHGVASETDGTAYLPRLQCDAAWVARSVDAGLTWQEVLVDGDHGTTGCEGCGGEHDSSVSVDAAGNVYYLFVDNAERPRLAVSRDRGATWSDSLDVGFPGLTATIKPVVVAGDEGKAAIYYVGTTVEGGQDAEPHALANATWFPFVGLSLNLLEADPVFATTYGGSPEDPLVRGPCERHECAVSQNPYAGIMHYLDADVDPTTGAVWTALVDMCADACIPGSETSADQARSRAAVSVQVGGTTIVG